MTGTGRTRAVDGALTGVWVLVLWAGAGLAWTQTAISGKPPQAPATRERILREIKDPHSGETWLLLQNTADPSGPGRLVRSGHGGGPEEKRAAEKRTMPVIHNGDRVVVEESGTVVEAHLEATALEPAAGGSPLHVRLKIGGRVIRAVAVAPGRVEVRP